jgi:hypothetical protein
LAEPTGHRKYNGPAIYSVAAIKARDGEANVNITNDIPALPKV